jgi:D-aminopeptidase
MALGFKGGIGTASRVVGSRTVGVLVQSNFSGTLTVRGVPIRPDAGGVAPVGAAAAGSAGAPAGGEAAASRPEGNSCMIVVATDAPLDARQLGRVARRAVFAMARVGSDFTGGSGDYALAFSTPGAAPSAGVADGDLDPLFAATMDAVEEALLNSLFMATTTVGHRGTATAVPHDLVLDRLRFAGVLPQASTTGPVS